MKFKVTLVLGIAVGTAGYFASAHGWSGIDWIRVGVVSLVSFLLVLPVPARWLGQPTQGSS